MDEPGRGVGIRNAQSAIAAGRRLGRSLANSQERQAMKFPYGISDFRQVIGEGYYLNKDDHPGWERRV